MASPRTLLIAVKSPLQAFNAVEYFHRAKADDPSVRASALVFCSARKPRLAQLLARLLAPLDGVQVQVVPVLPGERGWWHSSAEFLKTRLFHCELAAAVASLPPPDEVVLGDYRSRECRHLASLFPSARVVLLDDGSATHQIVRYRHDPDDVNLSANVPRFDWRTVRLRAWAGIALPFIDEVTFFSHYAFTPPTPDRLIPHRYDYWRGVAGAAPRPTSDEVLFLGMSHVEKNLTTERRYLESLRGIRQFYGPRSVTYRPHRDESERKLDAIRELGFTVAEPDIAPVELLLIEAKSLPSEVASIASSALDNLAVLFSDTLTLRCFTTAADYCNAPLAGHFTDIVRYHTTTPHPNLQVTALVA